MLYFLGQQAVIRTSMGRSLACQLVLYQPFPCHRLKTFKRLVVCHSAEIGLNVLYFWQLLPHGPYLQEDILYGILCQIS